MKFSAYRQESESYRLVRLKRVASKLNHKTKKLIYGLDDRKGNLTVSWSTSPTSKQRKEVEELWERTENECASNVEHVIKSWYERSTQYKIDLEGWDQEYDDYQLDKPEDIM